ncbi:RNA polymerase sigma-70 factor [Chitinophaga sp.]|uniref:RNA polymerase sigma factor n=1 Tax=Chitinophaga sp. TaxID=1869181 RepID=UPI002F949635
MNSTNAGIWTDEQLIELIQKDDQQAFELIYNRYSSKLYFSAWHLLHDTQVCEDLVQELFIHLWIKRHLLKVDTLRSYLYKAMRNKVLMYLRSGKAQLDVEALQKLAMQQGPDSHLLEKEMYRALDQGMEQLPDKCRQIFYLSRKKQLSNKEISGLLNISMKTVENQITIALKRLRISLEELLTITILLMAFTLT